MIIRRCDTNRMMPGAPTSSESSSASDDRAAPLCNTKKTGSACGTEERASSFRMSRGPLKGGWIVGRPSDANTVGVGWTVCRSGRSGPSPQGGGEGRFELPERRVDHVGCREGGHDHGDQLGGEPRFPVGLAPARKNFMSFQHRSPPIARRYLRRILARRCPPPARLLLRVRRRSPDPASPARPSRSPPPTPCP